MESDNGGGQDQLRERVFTLQQKNFQAETKTKDVSEHTIHEGI